MKHEHKDVLTRLEKRFSKEELAEMLDVHVNTIRRMRDKEGRLARRDELALLRIEDMHEMQLTVLRTGQQCVQRPGLSPIVRAPVAELDARWRVRLENLVDDEKHVEALRLNQALVRFEHATSDEERISELLSNPVAGARRWVMLVDVEGQWQSTSLDRYTMDDFVQLGLEEKQLFKPLDVWCVEAMTRTGWNVVGHFEAEDFKDANRQASEVMGKRGQFIMQWRSQRAG